jgi:hypothetical protein
MSEVASHRLPGRFYRGLALQDRGSEAAIQYLAVIFDNTM